jgi:transposase
LDLGVKETSFCEVAKQRVVQRATVRSLKDLYGLLGPGTARARIAIEASREAWFAFDLLREWGHDVVLVDTTRIRETGVGRHKRKTDRRDAEALAMALERGHLPLAHVLSAHRRQLRHKLSVRRALVETRAQYVTTIRGLARSAGHRLPRCEVEHFDTRVKATQLDKATNALIGPLLVLLKPLNEQIAFVERELEQLCQSEPTVQRLATMHGVSLIVAAAFVSVIDDATRFRRAHQVEAYLGLVPSEKSTGGRQRLGAITKHGNAYLRSLLVQTGWQILRRPSSEPLAAWGKAVRKRRGKAVAVVAVARRIAGILWAMWRRGTVYDPSVVGLTSARGLNVHAQTIDFQATLMKQAAQKLRRTAGATKTPKEARMA